MEDKWSMYPLLSPELAMVEIWGEAHGRRFSKEERRDYA
jgi:hypothetical protein